MYKLLLVTDREEVIAAFDKVPDLQGMMFSPITIIRDIREAISYLESNAVDAVGYSIRFSDVSPLHQYLVDVRPSLPIFQTHHHDDTLLAELIRIRKFLDSLHGDYADGEYDEAAVLEYLRDELMHQLLARQIDNPKELKSRMKLVRSQLALDKPCYLVDFDLPQGEVYLSDRWHYGRERLENCLRTNFFGRYVDNIYYGVAVLTPRHIRLLACPRQNSQEDMQTISQRAQRHIEKSVADIKEYLDLDLNVEQYTLLDNINHITGSGPQEV